MEVGRDSFILRGTVGTRSVKVMLDTFHSYPLQCALVPQKSGAGAGATLIVWTHVE